MERLEKPLSSQELGNAFLGLQNMPSDGPAVRDVLKQLEVQLQACADMHAVDLCNVYYGMACMDIGQEEVVGIFRAANRHLQTHAERSASFTASGLCRILGSLRCHSLPCADPEPVLSALHHTAQLLRTNSHDTASPNSICQAVNGLRRMTSDHEQVFEVLEVLTERIRTVRSALSTADVAAAFVGVAGMCADAPPVQAMVSSLANRTRGIADHSRRRGLGAVWSCADLLALLRGARAMGLQHKDVADLVSAVRRSLVTDGGDSCDENDSSSDSIDSSSHSHSNYSSSNSRDRGSGGADRRAAGDGRSRLSGRDAGTMELIFAELAAMPKHGPALARALREMDSPR